jgi:hypothetical protein
MTTRFTDAWIRSQADWYGDFDRFTVSGPTDAAHGDKSDAPPPLMMDSPRAQSGGEIFTDTVWEDYDNLPPATVIDETPVQGQGVPEHSGHGYGGVTRIGASDAELAAARGRDVGAATRATTTTPTYKFFSDVFFGFFTRGFEPPPMATQPSSPVFVRGINSHASNNGPQGRPTAWSVDGDGWKRGFYEGSAVDREFSPPRRHHGEFKMVEADIVTIIGDVAPPEKSDVYASPFSTLQTFLPKRRRVRGIRRDPGPWDEDLQAQEAGVITLAGADGMVVN